MPKKDKLRRTTDAVNQSAPDARVNEAAKLALGSCANAAAVIREYGKTFGTPDLGTLIEELHASVERVQTGDLKQCEAMLMAQALSLQAMFTSLARRALVQDYQSNLEAFLRLALKAQNQSRITLETLAAIKNPLAGAYVHQQNVAVNQQVNNGPPAGRADRPVAQTQFEPNELLEVQHGQRMDYGATGAASTTYSELEAMAPVHRPSD